MRKLFVPVEIWRRPDSVGGFRESAHVFHHSTRGHIGGISVSYYEFGGQGVTRKQGKFYTEEAEDVRTGDLVVWKGEKWRVIAAGDTAIPMYKVADVIWVPC